MGRVTSGVSTCLYVMMCNIVLRDIVSVRKHIDKSRAPPVLINCKRVQYKCDYCGNDAWEKKSAYARKKRHFCSQNCYSKYRSEFLPKEEQPAYGAGHSPEERKIRIKCRSTTNHAIRDGHLKREPCMLCGNVNSEAHHKDYNKPLDVMWLCFKHHRMYHKNPNLLEQTHE